VENSFSKKSPSKKDVELWLKDLDDTWEAAQKAAAAGIYFVAAFCIHQAVEKALKAAIVASKRKAPPKIHSLRQLYEEVMDDISLTEEEVTFLGKLTPVAYRSRYADVEFKLPSEIYTKQVVEEYLKSAFPIIKKLKLGIAKYATDNNQR
jgi:HEPN domain-containing protein